MYLVYRHLCVGVGWNVSVGICQMGFGSRNNWELHSVGHNERLKRTMLHAYYPDILQGRMVIIFNALKFISKLAHVRTIICLIKNALCWSLVTVMTAKNYCD